MKHRKREEFKKKGLVTTFTNGVVETSDGKEITRNSFCEKNLAINYAFFLKWYNCRCQ